MAKFLNTAQALGEVEGILASAKMHIVLISPFVKINDELIARLTDSGTRRKVKIKLVCRESALKLEEKVKISQIGNLELLFNEKVHAKCFYNESFMVITSLNLYDSASGDNHEMGVLLSAKEDEKAFIAAQDEAQYIIRESKRHNPKDSIRKPERKGAPQNAQGQCIRCGTGLVLDIEKPYCSDCYNEARYDIDEETEPIEHFCHSCGKETESSLSKPLCYSCYRKFRK
jgi:phosphatidylserine/phosphatidylglycerophosphate/cardiolipin synthase-like enzyme